MAVSENLARLIRQAEEDRRHVAEGVKLLGPPNDDNWREVGFLMLQLNIAQTQTELLVHIAKTLEDKGMTA